MRKIELLAPGGDVDSIKAAILAGANAVFCGLNKFNARNRAINISFDDLQGILSLAHQHGCQVFLTLNIVIVDAEVSALVKLLNRLVNTSIDGIIVQDLGVLYILSHYFKSLKVHASTQLTTHNSGQIQFLNQLGVERVNLSRELNISEIKDLTTSAHSCDVSTEVFVHGSYCISFSGLCYMSSLHGGNSGNRGRCSQPCRDRYETTSAGKDFPLNMKDNSAFFDLQSLHDAGVDSLKIEGRIKGYDYVHTTVSAWRKQLDALYEDKPLLNDRDDLYSVFNRDFSNAFLAGNVDSDMFVDNPSSHSTPYFTDGNNGISHAKVLMSTQDLFAHKEQRKTSVREQINQLDATKKPLRISISGKVGEPLQFSVSATDISFATTSRSPLSGKGTEPLCYDMLVQRFRASNETEYYIEDLQCDFPDGLYIPFKELNAIKKEILIALNNSKPLCAPVTLPKLAKAAPLTETPRLSVLISNVADLYLCGACDTDFYFQLPNSFQGRIEEFSLLFQKYTHLTPWFPALLIGDDYDAAVSLLSQLKTKSIVTENTGIALEADRRGVKWIAGPALNTTNSYSLLCLKEQEHCAGAFLSNEMSSGQLRSIRRPANFDLFYTIYRPIELMTSRQCLFHQTIGCHKSVVDESCIADCKKSTSVTNLKSNSFFISKEKGEYHKVYNDVNNLNLDVVNDLPGRFSSFLVDLRDVGVRNEMPISKKELIKHFSTYVNNTSDGDLLKNLLSPFTNSQYLKGL